MNHRTPSRSKRTEADTKRISGYALNKTTTSEVRETSVYEIDIRSSIDFPSQNDSENPSVKVCIANVSPLTLEKKSHCKDNTYKIVENQLIESHYPRFRDTDSESDRKPPSITAKTNLLTSPPGTPENTKNSYANCTSSKQALFEKSHVEAQSPSSDSQLKKKIKKQIIKGLLGKTESLLSRRGECGVNSDKELVHLHHHEHHHHYHINTRRRKDGSYPSKGTNTESRDSTEWAHNPPKCKADEVHSKHAFFCSLDKKSGNPVVKPFMSSERDDRKDIDKFVLKNLKSCKYSKATRLRNSNSNESMGSKPYLIKTHSFSDTDLVRCDSEDIIRCDVLKRKDSKTNYAELVKSLKSLNAFTPAMMAEQISKFSMQQGSPETKSSVSTLSYTVPDKATETPSENKLKTRMDKQDSGTGPYIVRRYQNGRLDSIPLQTWTEKIKTELREIKKELKLIERRYLKEKTTKSTAVTQSVSSSMESRTEEEPGNEVSVFSSKTFILRAENFYIIEENDSGPFSDDIENFFENDELCYAETETGRFLVSPNGSWLHFKKDDPPSKKVWGTAAGPRVLEIVPAETTSETKDSDNKSKRYIVVCNDSLLRKSE